MALLDPFHGGSHAQWSTGYQRHSNHEIALFTLPGKYWKWRMHGGAVALAEQFLAAPGEFDLVVATDMLDLATFAALTRSRNVPLALYFHENQLAYPWSAADADVALRRDNHYAFINYTSALTADRIYFNSPYNQSSFLEALPGFLKAFPDRRGLHRIPEIEQKAQVLPLGMELEGAGEMVSAGPRIVWNHRWEYDKGPEEFFAGLVVLREEGHDFELAVLGEQYRRSPKVFEEAREKLSDRVVQWGFAEDRADYWAWLKWGNLLPVTSRHDFFGGSVVEALAAGCRPLLPERLNYPHLTGDRRAFYSEGGFLPGLRRVLEDWPASYFDASAAVQPYDWSVMAPRYDAEFSALVGSFL